MEVTRRTYLQVALSVLILRRGNGLEIFLLAYHVLCGYKYDLRSAGRFLSSDILKYFALLVSSYIVLRIIRRTIGLGQTSIIRNDSPLRPCFFRCQTTHSRMFPVKHSFSYSYLLTGVPIGFKGSVGGLISVDEEKKNWVSRKSWFTVHGDDYLARGHHPDGLKGKLQDFLASQKIDHTQYSHAYLLTAAKFMNYSSNPVSIWHLYSQTNELKALVLEVNNTFDERHNYFLEPLPKPLNISPNAGCVKTRYTSKWPKNFYVSTFNDRSGRYSLSAVDPLAPNLTGSGYINMNITLSGPSNDNAMIVTLLRSSNSPLYPENMSAFEKLQFLSKWWWVGFATFPRTLQQAFKLFFRRKMPWAFRPEPRQGTISRPADMTEMFIEKHFRAFLRNRVEQSEEAVVIRYQSAGLSGENNAACIFNPTKLKRDAVLNYEIVVLTPAFYSNLLLYSSLRNALNYESAKNETISLSRHDLISKLLVENSESCIPSLNILGLSSPTKSVLLALSYLRNDPLLKANRDKTSTPNSNPNFPRVSELDTFMLQHATPAELRTYTWKLARLVMIDHIALNSLILWDLEVFFAHTLSLFFLLRKTFG